jgi:hypothetical protein
MARTAGSSKEPDPKTARATTSRGLPRRALLSGMAGGGGALVAAGVGNGVAKAAAEPAGDAFIQDPKHLDIRETEHVRWFYRRARM